MQFGEKIIYWYRKNKRELPWRNTRNPYYIWLSEIILQQTRVEQGLPYFLRFRKKFPTVRHLAKAPLEDVLKLWQGLGYYSRARNLHKAARLITEHWKGKFPEEYSAIRSLPGIGEYTAAAIASFAYNQKYAVVDGNVYRLLSRFFGISTPIDSSEGKKEFKLLAEELLEGYPPHEYNQAIMEFGARQCKPVSPDCSICPLQSACFAFEKKQVDQLPFKAKKTKVRNRYFHYLDIQLGNKRVVRQREAGDIWSGLFEFPLVETKNEVSFSALQKSKSWKSLFGKTTIKKASSKISFKHQLSHQSLFVNFLRLEMDTESLEKLPNNWKMVSPAQLKKLPVSRLMEKYLNGE